MVNIIPESGMVFVADNTFHIEESSLYTDIGEGVRTVEFIRVKNGHLLFVEAKTSFPNPDNSSPDNLVVFQSEIDEICEKFIHSLNLLSSVEVGVADDVYTDDFTMPEKVSLVFVLVIKDHELKWCRPVKKKLEDALPPYLRTIWKPTVYVINHATAISRNLAIG